MKKQSIIFPLCLFCLVNTIDEEGKIDRIKTFELKEKQAEQAVQDAKTKLNDEKPELEANQILWENKAEDIRINHGQQQHVVGSPEAIYWKGEWDKANNQASGYQQQIVLLKQSLNSREKEKEQIIMEKNNVIQSYLDSLNNTEIPLPCKYELERAQTDLYSVTSSRLESLSHCWSINFDGKGKSGIVTPRGDTRAFSQGVPDHDIIYLEKITNRQIEQIMQGINKIDVKPPAPPQKDKVEQATDKVLDIFNKIINNLKPTRARRTSTAATVRG